MRRFAAMLGAVLMMCLVAAPQAGAALKLYEESDFLGRVLLNKSAAGNWNLTGGNNDEASSFNNATQLDGGFWHDSNLRGTCVGMRRQTSAAWFAVWDDNKASSVKLGSYC